MRAGVAALLRDGDLDQEAGGDGGGARVPVHHDAPPVLLVAGHLHHLREPGDGGVPGRKRIKYLVNCPHLSLLQVPVIVAESEECVPGHLGPGLDLELEVLLVGAVAGAEGDVAVEVVGVVQLGVLGVRLQPEVLGTPVQRPQVHYLVLQAGGDVVRLAQD